MNISKRKQDIQLPCETVSDGLVQSNFRDAQISAVYGIFGSGGGDFETQALVA